MSESWNERNVRKPPMRSTMQKLQKDINFNTLLECFEHCENINDSRPKLEGSAAMASRLIARRAQSFRVQPSFMYFRKMNIALCRLKELNIYQDIKDIHHAIGVAKTARQLDDKYYLPDQENFIHFLSKFQSFAKLMIRIVMCARESHRLFLELLHRAAFIETISLFISVLADVWSICIGMCRSAVQFYNEFYPFYAKNYERSTSLPKRLDMWLGEEYKEYIDVSVDENVDNVKDEFFLFDGNDNVNVEGEGIVLVEQKFEPKLLVTQNVRKGETGSCSTQNKRGNTNDLLKKQQNYANTSKANEVKVKPKITMQALSSINKSFDFGEKICRSNTPNQMIEKRVIKQMNVDQVKTIKDIREFLSTEDELRHSGDEVNTTGVNNEDWEKFKASTNSLLILSHHGLVLKKFKNQFKHLRNRR